MALIKCKECENEVSTTAKTCPKCGAKVVHTSRNTKLVAVLIGLFVLFGIYNSISASREKDARAEVEQARVAALSPEQRANEGAQSAEAAKNKQLDEIRFQKAVLVVRAVKQSLLDPSSARWEGVFADKEGDTVCVTVVAKNGFGGPTEEFISAKNGNLSRDRSEWNKRCGKGAYLFNVHHALRAL